MKRTQFKSLLGYALATLLLMVGNTPLAAQNESNTNKTTITVTVTNPDGTKTVEKIVREGEDVSEEEMDELLEKYRFPNKKVDVRVEKEVRKEVKKGEENSWIEKDGKTINLDELEGERIIIIEEDDEAETDGKKMVKKKVMVINGEDNATGDEEMEVTVTVDEDGTTRITKKRKKMAPQEDVEAKLEKMGIELPTLGTPVANYVHAVTAGNNLVFLAGKGPRKADGKNITGKLGKDLTIEEGYEAARWAGINLLAALKGEIGDLNRVRRIVKVKGMVNAVPEFTDHSKVINGFSDLMVELFGDRGRHARAAVGMSSLPGNMAVEIEVVVEIE